MKRIIKYIRNIFIIILSLLIILIFLSQTGIFNNLLRDIITDKLNKTIEGEILIGSIKGNLFSNIEIDDIQIRNKETSVISVKKIEIDYNILSLFKNEIKVRSLIIDSVDFNLVQLKDSSWNISNLFKSSEDTNSVASSRIIFLVKTQIKNSNIKIFTLNSASKIPKEIENINLDITGFYSHDSSNLTIRKFNFNTLNPSFAVKELRLNANSNRNAYRISGVYIETDLNKIFANGYFRINPFDSLKVNIKTGPINSSEFKYFTGIELKRFSPSVIIYLNKKGKDIYLESALEEKKQNVNIKLRLNGNNFPEGNAEIKISDLNPADIIEDNSFNGLINCVFNLNGYWKNVNNSRIRLRGKIYNSVFRKRIINSSKFSAQYNNGRLSSNISVQTESGIININAVINEIFGNPVYSYQLALNDVDLSKLFLVDSLKSNLNLTIQGDGIGFNPAKMINNFEISSVKPIRINKYKIDSLLIIAEKNKDSYLLDSLFIKNGENKFSASGEYLNSNFIKSNLHLSIKNFENIKPYINANILDGSLAINGELSGSTDSLSVKSNIELNNFHYNNLFLTSGAGGADGILKNYKINGDYFFRFNNIKYDSVKLSAIDLRGNYKDEQFNSEANIIFSDSVETNIFSFIKIDSAININVPLLNVNKGNRIWQNKKGSIIFSANKNNYLLKNFNLQNDASSVSIYAEISSNKKLTADIKLQSIELSDLLKRYNLNTGFFGPANLNLKASGSTDNPEVTGYLKLNKLNIDSNDIGDITAEFNIKQKIFTWDLLIDKTTNQLKSSGYFHLKFSPGFSENIIDRQKEFEANLFMNNFELAKAGLISDYFDKIEGNVNCNISIKNNLADPRLTGNLQLSALKVQNNELGINYKDIIIKLKIDSNRITIDTASLAGSKGIISLSGYAASKGNILKSRLKDININLHSSNFELLNRKNSSVSLDGDLCLFSKNDTILFNGQFKIPRSSFYIASWGGSKTESKEVDASLLLQAISKKDQTGLKSSDSEHAPSSLLTYVKDINGRIKIEIPDNTWIKNPNFNIELKGNLILEKKENDLILTGRIKTGRGFLYLYGKKFTITKGELIFNGEKKINPYVNATIEYVFRNPAREKEKIVIYVTNTANDPSIKFTHNEEIITEGDAISYILFGIKMENLTQSQQSELSGSPRIISNAFTGMLASQLTSKLGNKIGLDVLEISGDENWEKASFTAGKYINNDLFVSYERNIPLGNSNETEIKKINFEYELFNFLFIQLIGGNSKEQSLNFILKFD